MNLNLLKLIGVLKAADISTDKVLGHTFDSVPPNTEDLETMRTRAQMYRLLEEGMTAKEVAKTLHIARSDVYNFARRSNLTTKREHALPTSAKEAIVEAYSNTDIPVRDIAKTLNISYSTLYDVLDEYGVPRRN